MQATNVWEKFAVVFYIVEGCVLVACVATAVCVAGLRVFGLAP